VQNLTTKYVENKARNRETKKDVVTTTGDVKIRKILSEDFKTLVEFGTALMDSRLSLDIWRAYLQSYMNPYFPPVSQLAEVTGKIVGAALGEIKGWELGSPLVGWVNAIAVLPDFRSKGIAKKLLLGFVDECRRAGVRSIHMVTPREEEMLQALLRSVGFRRGSFVDFEIKS
jgi:ribosomal protein S18 acetylase RimI-like enzyme